MTDSTTEPGSTGQTFLIGETLYLRGLESGDAKRAAAWRSSPFPVPVVRAEELLKEDIPKQAEQDKVRLIACRIADDTAVGSVEYRYRDWRTAWVSAWADPALGGAGAATKAEILRLVVPWFSTERHAMVVWAAVEGGEPEVPAELEALGMREAFRLREAIWRDGARHDFLAYELLHPAWVDRLGDPRAAGGNEPAPAGTPRRRPATEAAPGPANAMMAGEHVYLRPYEVEDGERAARWNRQETETFFDNGRWVTSPVVSAHWVRQMAKSDPPEHIELAVALRDGDELIGEVGIYGIDWVHRTAETGSYLYRPEHRGGGLGTEAKHLLLGYAFDRLGLHMVRSFVWAPNTRSAAALRKQGYRDAGRLCWNSLKDGDFTDVLIFDLLAEEWRAARKAGDGG